MIVTVMDPFSVRIHLKGSKTAMVGEGALMLVSKIWAPDPSSLSTGSVVLGRFALWVSLSLSVQ